MEVKYKEISPDRWSFSLGAKISDNNYGSRDIHVSYSSDVRPDEPLGVAKKRIFTELLDAFSKVENMQLGHLKGK